MSRNKRKLVCGWTCRLRLAHKLLAACAAFALPVAGLLVYAISGLNRSLQLAERETQGTRALEILPALVGDIAVHERLNTAAAQEAAGHSSNVYDISNRIDDALARLNNIAGGKVHDSLESLQVKWRTVKERRATFSQNRDLGPTIGGLVQELGNTSGLTQDPGVESFHLMQLAVTLMPQAQIASIEGAPAGAVLHVLLPQMRRVVEIHTTKYSMGQDSGAPPESVLSRAFSQYTTAVEYLFAQRKTPDSERPLDEQAARAAAVESGTRLWNAAIGELRRAIEVRAAQERTLRTLLIASTLFLLAVANAIVLWVGRRLSRPLQVLADLTNDVAAGRLQQAKEQSALLATTEAGDKDIRDETGLLIQAFSQMSAQLHSLMGEVRRSMQEVAGSSSTVAAAVQELESAVSEQVASAHTVNTSSKVINTTVQHLAKTITEVTDKAFEAAESARGGMASLDGIHAAIDQLVQASERLAGTLQTINAKTGSIDEVVDAITKVANRTNLLSLNAAIEAEKAGEQALGFTVVALEIRRLADQTAAAGLDIERLISEMQASVRDGAAGVERHAMETRASSVAIEGLSGELTQVIENTQALGPAFEAVNESMHSQEQAASQITDSMQHLLEAASLTRNTLTDFRGVAEHLHVAVANMQAEVARFSTAE